MVLVRYKNRKWRKSPINKAVHLIRLKVMDITIRNHHKSNSNQNSLIYQKIVIKNI